VQLKKIKLKEMKRSSQQMMKMKFHKCDFKETKCDFKETRKGLYIVHYSGIQDIINFQRPNILDKLEIKVA